MVYLLVFTATVLWRLKAQIDKVKNAFYMDLHGWYEIWFDGKIKNITILNKFLILK